MFNLKTYLFTRRITKQLIVAIDKETPDYQAGLIVCLIYAYPTTYSSKSSRSIRKRLLSSLGNRAYHPPVLYYLTECSSDAYCLAGKHWTMEMSDSIMLCALRFLETRGMYNV